MVARPRSHSSADLKFIQNALDYFIAGVPAFGYFELEAGGPSFSISLIDELKRLDYTTPIPQRRGTGLAFPGGRPFRLQKGRGFWKSAILLLCSYIYGVTILVHGPVRMG